jgi:N-acetylglucosaminyl-diphospho-decaprenol L-rhamnosyltransferase
VICISVVSHGQMEIAAAFLQTIARFKPPLVSHVVYTRNIGEPDLPALDLGPARLEIISNSVPKGFGANHNAAFERCRSPFFCVCNPDILLASDPFPRLIEPFEKQNVGLVAPRVLTPAGRVENTARSLYTPFELLSQKLRPANLGGRADWLAGMFLLFRSQAFRGVGGFDAGYFLYIEDVDICSRLRVAGWELLQHPEAEVVHDARKQSHRSLKYTRWHLAGMLRYWSSPGFWRHRRLLSRDRRHPPTM